MCNLRISHLRRKVTNYFSYPHYLYSRHGRYLQLINHWPLHRFFWNSHSARCSENSFALITLTCGKSICFKMSKCLSLDTMYCAFAVIQQSTNLLSSKSDCIRLNLKYGVTSSVFWAFNIVAITLFAISEVVFLDIISEYSSMISVETHRMNWPSRNISHIIL